MSDWLIPDDDNSTSLGSILSGTVDYQVKGFLYPSPAGEGGDRLASGHILASNEAAGDLSLLDQNQDFALVATVPFNIAAGSAIRAHHASGSFFAGQSASPPVVKQIDTDGSFLATHTLTGSGSTNISGLAVNEAGTILYHSTSTAGTEIKAWDLVGNAPLSNFAAGVTGYTAVDIVALADGSVVVRYFRGSDDDLFVRVYNSAGATVLDIPVGTSSGANTTPRMAYDITEPGNVTLFWHPSAGLIRLSTFRISDGALMREVDHATFELGAYTGGEDADAPRFGAPFSCPIVPLGIFIVVVIVDPSVPVDCCDDACGCRDTCCGSGPTLAAGRAGDLLPPAEGTATTLVPPSTGGRLGGGIMFDPTPPESWVF
jgi:hypothetical protein